MEIVHSVTISTALPVRRAASGLQERMSKSNRMEGFAGDIGSARGWLEDRDSGNSPAVSGEARPTNKPQQPIGKPGTVRTELFHEQEDHRDGKYVGTRRGVGQRYVVPRHVLGLGQVPPAEIIRARESRGRQGAGDLNAVAQEKDVRSSPSAM